MPIPEFVVALRRRVGHDPLWLPAVTAVVLRGSEVLLVRRRDNNAWAPITGIIDPGEQPAVAAAREVMEETGVRVHVESLARVRAAHLTEHANGDQAYYLDLLFKCRYDGGSAYVADEESVDVGWFSVSNLPAMGPVYVDRIQCVLDSRLVTRFER